MATLVPRNPRLMTGELRHVQVPSAVTTWKAGQWLYAASGLATACASDATAVQYVALSDQNTNPSSGALEEVGLITADQTWEIFELDGTLAAANVGESYGIDVTANILTVDEAETTAKSVKIVRLASDYEPERNVAADVKARCEVRVLTSVIDG